MKAAFIGLPGSGKSTLFGAVTGTRPDPYAAPQVHRLVVKVPDARLGFLTRLYQPKKVTEASVEFLDVPGFSLGDPAGVSEFKKVLPDIRQADVLAVVVRDFDSADIPSYKNRVDAPADFAEVWSELIFADLDSVSTRIERLHRSLQKPSKTHDHDQHELKLLERCRATLEAEKPLSCVLDAPEERKQLASFAFLTEKPLVVVRNVSESRIREPAAELSRHARYNLTLCASAEEEIALLPPEDRAPFLADLGIEQPARDRLIRSCHEAAGVICFLTMGPDEVRAWEIPRGSSALEAAARIHSDLARGFIRAETVSYEDLKTHDDLKGARAAGKVRQEGKAYIVQDGDILNIKFNV